MSNKKKPNEISPEPATYKVMISCMNCRFAGEVEITKGIMRKDYVRGRRCPICGCCELY